MKVFTNVAIIGLGLIGGSIAIELKQKSLSKKIIGFDASKTNCRLALEQGFVDSAQMEIDKSISQADLVILAVPVGALIYVVESIKPHLHPKAIITDVGSVKVPIVNYFSSPPNNKIKFVGAHPIAGSEQFGPQAARSGLFENKKLVLTPNKSTGLISLAAIQELWQSIGCNVVTMDAQLHDSTFCEVSHLPHLLAYACISHIGGLEADSLRYSGAGLKDFSRISSSSPSMWSSIFLQNKEYIIPSLKKFARLLKHFENLIENDKEDELTQLLTSSKTLRDKWVN